MRRVVVARWGDTQGEFVLTLLEGGHVWDKIAESDVTLNTRDAAGFVVTSTTTFLSCYSTGPDTAVSTYLRSCDVSSGAFVWGASHLFWAGNANTDIRPTFPPLYIAADNGGEGRMGGTSVRTTDGRFLVSMMVDASTLTGFGSGTNYIDVYSLNDAGETTRLSRSSYPKFATVLALDGARVLAWQWSTGVVDLLQVADDGTITVVRSGTIPLDVNGFLPAGLFWLPATGLIGAAFTANNLIAGHGYGDGVTLTVASPDNLVFRPLVSQPIDSGGDPDPFLDPWMTETAGGALLGYAAHDGTGTDTFRTVVPVALDDPVVLADHVNLGEPLTVGAHDLFILPTFVTTNGVFYVNDEETGHGPLYAAPVTLSGAADEPIQFSSLILQYGVIDVLVLGTEYVLAGAAGDVRVRFTSSR